MKGDAIPEFGLAQLSTLPAWASATMQLSMKAMAMAATSQQVVAMRLLLLATAGNTASNRREIERMVTEKVDAVNESARVLLRLGGAMAQAWPTMFLDPAAAGRMLHTAAKAGDRALTPFARRVTANQRRLSR